jgi:hypothetical protein
MILRKGTKRTVDVHFFYNDEGPTGLFEKEQTIKQIVSTWYPEITNVVTRTILMKACRVFIIVVTISLFCGGIILNLQKNREKGTPQMFFADMGIFGYIYGYGKV